MLDFKTIFCVKVTSTVVNINLLVEKIKQLEDIEYQLSPQVIDTHQEVLIFSDEAGDPDELAAVLSEWVKLVKYDSIISFTYAGVASNNLPFAFCGGAICVYPTGEIIHSQREFMTAMDNYKEEAAGLRLVIDKEYVRKKLEQYQKEVSPETLTHATKIWIAHLQTELDTVFSDVMDMCGVKIYDSENPDRGEAYAKEVLRRHEAGDFDAVYIYGSNQTAVRQKGETDEGYILRAARIDYDDGEDTVVFPGALCEVILEE